jgi:hypothetical protein
MPQIERAIPQIGMETCSVAVPHFASAAIAFQICGIAVNPWPDLTAARSGDFVERH